MYFSIFMMLKFIKTVKYEDYDKAIVHLVVNLTWVPQKKKQQHIGGSLMSQYFHLAPRNMTWSTGWWRENDPRLRTTVLRGKAELASTSQFDRSIHFPLKIFWENTITDIKMESILHRGPPSHFTDGIHEVSHGRKKPPMSVKDRICNLRYVTHWELRRADNRNRIVSKNLRNKHTKTSVHQQDLFLLHKKKFPS